MYGYSRDVAPRPDAVEARSSHATEAAGMGVTGCADHTPKDAVPSSEASRMQEGPCMWGGCTCVPFHRVSRDVDLAFYDDWETMCIPPTIRPIGRMHAA